MTAAVATPFVATTTDVDALCDNLLGMFPWVHVDRSTLGGEARASLFIKVSLDPKETWQGGIVENSRWALFGVQGGKLYMIAGSYDRIPKFRKVDAKSVTNIINKLMTWKGKV
jgi:hypothetical protein